MRILTINHEFPPIGGGGGVASYQVCKHLIRFGHHVDVITQSYTGLRHRENIDGMNINRVDVGRKKINVSSKLEMLRFILKSFFLAKKLNKENRYDAVLAFFAVPSGAVARMLKKSCGIHYVISMQGSDVPEYDPGTHSTKLYRILKPLITGIWKNATFLTANSDYMKKLAHKFCSYVDIVTIFNGVDFENYENIKKKKRSKVFRTISVSRIVERKGLQFFLNSLPSTSKERKIEVMIVGDGPYRNELEKIKKQRRLNCVKFLGRVDHRKLPDYYSKADIFVLPSTVEAFGVVFAEAMAAGLPVIGTRVGGIPEIVEDGKTGLLVPPNDGRKLWDAVQRLMNDEKLRMSMGKAGRERVKKLFTWEIIAGQFEELIKKSKIK